MFPVLKDLDLGNNPDSADVGVTVLSNGLLSASRTRLTSLDLIDTQVDHLGMAALGAVIEGRRFSRLETLTLSYNRTLSDKAIFVFVKAIQQAKNALPHLQTLEMDELFKVTDVAVGVVLISVLQNCPQLEWISISKRSKTCKDSLDALISTLGAKEKVKV